MKTAWKKGLSLLLCLVLLAGFFPTVQAEDVCTLYLDTNGGEYFEPITVERFTEIRLPEPVWIHHVFLGWAQEENGKVCYQAEESLTLEKDMTLYAVWQEARDLHLSAYVAGTTQKYKEITVPTGDSVTLCVDAQVDPESGLYYRWVCGDMDPPVLLEGAEANTLFLDAVDRHYWITCQVFDDEGNCEEVNFDISTDTGLWACVAGSDETYQAVTVTAGEQVILQVEAGVREESALHYWWYSEELDPSLLPEGEGESSLILDGVDRYCWVTCEVYDDYGNHKPVSFEIFMDTGLWAYVAGTRERYQEITVTKGESVLLSVEAGVSEGGLRYRWYSDELDPALLPQDESTTSVVIDPVEQYCWVTCYVYDDSGNRLSVNFEIFTDTGLWAYVAGTRERYQEITVTKGESVLLSVEAGVSEGGLRYRWYSDELDPALLPQDESTTSVVIDPVNQYCWVTCEVYDDYGNHTPVSFEIFTDTGLRAWAFDTGEENERLTPSLGESVTLRVEAEVNEGGLHYTWHSEELDAALLSGSKDSTVLVIPSADRYYWIDCVVSDDSGNRKSVSFEICPDVGLWAYIAESEDQFRQISVESGESVTLRVEAGVNEGEYHCRWESEQLDPAILQVGDGGLSCTISQLQRAAEAHCIVSDDYGNNQYLQFDLRTKTGLRAWDKDTGNQYSRCPVAIGGSITLTVEATVDEGELHYHWQCEDADLPELPTDDKTTSVTIHNIELAHSIACLVYDDEENCERVDFYVYPDSGLEAWAVETGTNNWETTVPAGSSVTLAVDGHTNAGELRYRWTCYEGDPSVLPTDEETKSFTIQNVDQRYLIICDVRDEVGASIMVYFSITVDNELKVYIAGTQSNRDYYFDSSAPQTLKVDAHAREGELQYVWKYATADDPDFYRIIREANGPTLEVGEVTEPRNYICEVTDAFNSYDEVRFFFRLGMEIETLQLDRELTLESDPRFGEAYVSFTPEVTGVYAFRTAPEDPECYLFRAGNPEGYSVNFPAMEYLEAGTTYYFVVENWESDFTVHLTVSSTSFSSMEELKLLLENAVPGDFFQYAGSDDPFVIAEDLIIPSEITVLLEDTDLVIAEGAGLTVEEGALLYGKDLSILGQAQNDGIIACSSLSGREKLQHGDQGITVQIVHVETETALRAAVQAGEAESDPHYIYNIVFHQDLTLTRDLTLPSNVVVEGDGRLCVASGVTLELSPSNPMLIDRFTQFSLNEGGELLVQGTLRNNGEMILYGAPMQIEEGGAYCAEGVLSGAKWSGTLDQYFSWMARPEFGAYGILPTEGFYLVLPCASVPAGDVNISGSFESADLIRLRRILLAEEPVVSFGNTDVNEDGNISILDLIRLHKMLLEEEQLG